MSLIDSELYSAVSAVVLIITPITAKPNEDFTLYFLGYDHGGDSVKSGTQFTREGEIVFYHSFQNGEILKSVYSDTRIDA